VSVFANDDDDDGQVCKFTYVYWISYVAVGTVCQFLLKYLLLCFMLLHRHGNEFLDVLFNADLCFVIDALVCWNVEI